MSAARSNEPDHNRPHTSKEETMSKQIEPTDAMVDAMESARELVALDARTILRAALNHPDAAGLFADEDDRPWKPLDGRPLNVGDEVRQDYGGITRTAVVGGVDGGGNPWTAEGELIGLLCYDTWYVRRPVKELPTTGGIPIVANDGHESIEAVFRGIVWRTREAVLGGDGLWHGVWRAGRSVVGSAAPELITPGTWKVADQ